jgi:GNAT superfamily N-acetyltransferase
MNPSPTGLRTAWRIEPLPVRHPESSALLRQYYDDIAGRYHGRQITETELDAILAEFTSDDLTLPSGYFLVGRYGHQPAGCVGLRVLSPEVAELTRLFVHRRARRTGGGGRLLTAAEEAAVAVLGASVMRLDTRNDLIEARALYTKHGYTEIPPYKAAGPYNDHWFERKLVQDLG